MNKHTQLDPGQIASLCRGLALLLHSGIDMAESVCLLRREAQSIPDRALEELESALQEGQTLSSALAHTQVFPGYVCALTRIGEESGHLEESLNALADYYEAQLRFTRLLKNALTYPSLVLLMMLMVVAVLLIKVLPIFDRVYASMGAGLTGLAAGMLALGQVLRGAMPVLACLLALAGVLALLTALYPPFREGVRKAFLGRLGDRGTARKFNNAKYVRGLSMGLSSGLPLEECVELAGGLTADIPGAAARGRRCKALLEEGSALPEAMEEAGILTASAARLLTAGLRGGNTDRVLQQLAEGMMEDAQQSLEETVARVEPTMVLLLSAVVGVILLSTMLPLMNILSSIG